MPIINLEDFTRTDGSVDWSGLRAAEINNGECCKTCGSYLINLFSTPAQPKDCGRCVDLKNSADEVRHSDYVRCPRCSYIFDLTTLVSENCLYDLYQEGEHNMTCPECEHDFKIGTSVSYTFTSPAKESHREHCEEVRLDT